MNKFENIPWKTVAPDDGARLDDPKDTYVTIEKWDPRAFKPHFHDAFNWLMPVSPGYIRVNVEGNDITVTERNWILIFPNITHSVDEASSGVDVLSLFVPHECMFCAWKSLNLTWEEEEKYLVGGKTTIARGLAMQWSEIRHEEKESHTFLSEFTDYMCRWLWSFQASLPDSDDFFSFARDKSEYGAKLLNLFHDNIEERPFPWEQTAKALGLSARSLQRKIKTDYSCSPSALLASFKIEKAKAMIKEGVNLTEISYACGYASQSHFTTAFKVATNTSPSQYRKALES